MKPTYTEVLVNILKCMSFVSFLTFCIGFTLGAGWRKLRGK